MQSKHGITALTCALTLVLTLRNSASADVTYQLLKSFGDPSPGHVPSGLVQGSDGALYGALATGGSNDNGTVFRLNPDGTGFEILVNLDASVTGASPYGALIQATDGALYGTASAGGDHGYGTIFKVNPDGTDLTALYHFDYFTTGGQPLGGLVQGTNGALYGTAYAGGSNDSGTVFRLDPDGTGFTVLQQLDYLTTGGGPLRLLQGTNGALHGTARYGGTSGWGTVFTLNPDGTGFAVLHHFDYLTTGAQPGAGLAQGMDGTLYGTASAGGSNEGGTVFKLNPDGTGFAILKHFDGATTGGALDSGVTLGSDGALHGTATFGGSGSACSTRPEADLP